MEMKMGPTATF